MRQFKSNYIWQHLTIILVSYCCYNRQAQTKWIKATQTYYFIVCESKVWYESHWDKIKGVAGLKSFLEALEKNHFPCPFGLVEQHPHILVRGHFPPLSSQQNYTSLCLLFIVTSFLDHSPKRFSTFRAPCDKIEPLHIRQRNIHTARSFT